MAGEQPACTFKIYTRGDHVHDPLAKSVPAHRLQALMDDLREVLAAAGDDQAPALETFLACATHYRVQELAFVGALLLANRLH